MSHKRSKLGLIIAGSYLLIAAIVLSLNFRTPQSSILTALTIILTAPWSLAVIFLGFLLIHISTHGMDYGFMVGTAINALLLYFLVNKRVQKKV